MFDTVIFDLDGTLSDNSRGILGSVRYALDRMGLPAPETAVLRTFIGPPLMMSFINHCGMNTEEAQQAVQYYCERFETTGYLENRLYPGIRDLLIALKRGGTALALATGKPKDITCKILSHFGILHLFDQVEGSVRSATTNRKADLIARIRQHLPGSAVMVGDTADDIIGARDAGIDGIFVRYGFGDEADLLGDMKCQFADDPADLGRLLLGAPPEPRGLLISLEGLDGCGKTTVANHLERLLTDGGYRVVHTREPGGCAISERIRDLLLSPEHREMTATTEALLYAASRSQHVTDVILPALKRGEAVISDRYIDSSIAYQGLGRGLGAETVRAMNADAMRRCMPDVTLYLRLGAEVSLSRRLSASAPDRIEREKQDFFERAGEAFDRLAAEEPQRFLVIDAGQSADQVMQEIENRLPTFLIGKGIWA